MRKLFVCFVLTAAMLAFSVPSSAPLLAQAKKDTKDKDTKSKTAKTAAGVIEIGEGKDGKFRFFVRDEDGKLLAMSGPGGFASEKEARAAIDSLKEVVAKAKVTTLAKKKGK